MTPVFDIATLRRATTACSVVLMTGEVAPVVMDHAALERAVLTRQMAESLLPPLPPRMLLQRLLLPHRHVAVRQEVVVNVAFTADLQACAGSVSLTV